MQLFNVGNTSLLSDGGVKPVEIYIPLWFANGSNAVNIITTAAASGSALLDGSTVGALSATNAKLHTLSSNWASTKFALEVTIYTQNAAATASAQLYDITGSALVSGSSVSTSSTTAIVIRSGQFTLTPSHQYGITFWTNNSSYSVSLTDASLIVFP